MEKTPSVKEEMDGEVFISRQSRHYLFLGNMIEVLFPICTLVWRVNICLSRQGKLYIGEMKVELRLLNL